MDLSSVFTMSCVLMLLGLAQTLEEMQSLQGILPWSVVTSCKFRRSMNRDICCSDLHCPSNACCELYFVMGGLTAQGRCVTRDPNTHLCSRVKNCRSHLDCNPGECCRLAYKGHDLGVCDKLGHQGNVCTTKPVFVHGFPLLCPCGYGTECQADDYNIKGMCARPFSHPITPPIFTTPTTTTTTPPPTTTPTTTTTTRSPCASCPDKVFFCCLDNTCKIRPILGEPCGATLCPCRGDSTCSDPFAADNSGVCV